MKIPKYIDTALKRRTLYAEKLNNAMCIVDEFLDNNKIECESYDTHTGVEIYCNPYDSERRIRECIEKAGVDNGRNI
mgnify:CR=1 FL=1|jgi:hypothetical protein